MNEPDDNTIDAEIVEDPGTAVAIPAAAASFPPTEPVTDYTDDGVPTFDYVRDQIESRFATSLGGTELAGGSPAATSIDEQFAAREQAGKDRLEQIRRAMREQQG